MTINRINVWFQFNLNLFSYFKINIKSVIKLQNSNGK